MRITQGYVSKSIMDFPFHQIYTLDDYNCAGSPSVFFGCYRYEDVHIINNHFGSKIVFWTGQDALDFEKNNFELKGNITHITAHRKVYNLLAHKFDNVKLVAPSTFLNKQNAQRLGKKIYAYCPSSAPEYHGSKVIYKLKCDGYEIVTGDGRWTQAQWRSGKADEFYNEVGIGLCLSEFAGGGSSIIEMGLRGIRVVTNVFNLPNCIPWTDADEVAKLIDLESDKIGTTSKGLANAVWHSLDHDFKWLEI